MRKFLEFCRRYFMYAAFFSLFINILMLTLPLYMLNIFDRVITSRSSETLLMLTIAALGAFMLHLMFEQLRRRLLLGAGIALDGMAGPPVLERLLETAVKPGTNEYITAMKDVGVLRGFLTGPGITAIFDSPWTPIFIFVIFMFHPLLGIVALTGAMALTTVGYLNERLTRGPLEEMSMRTRRAAHYLDSGLRNAEVLSALGMRNELLRRWQRLNAGVIDAQVHAATYANALGSLTRFLRLSLQVIMLAIGAYLVIRQHVSPGIMIAGTLILSRALSPLESAIHSWKTFVDARESYRRLDALLKLAPEEVNRVRLPAPRGRVEVDRVSYTIPGTDRAVIKNVSFTLEPGESMGLIGPSAAGKSTLARLIMGVWRPTSGIVRLDGADISTWPREDVGPHVGYLPQDVELFAGTVGENIARLTDATSEAVIKAARRAHVHEMIVRLPKAYDTEIGDGGLVLSAGQRQRIALARAVFGNPRLVVLDEPNANLDTEGEEALVKTLRQLAQRGVTVIIISHRPSLLAGVDRLLVLKDGQVDIFGPREEVMARVRPRPGFKGTVAPMKAAGKS